MKKKVHLIAGIRPGSIAEEAGIDKGDRLVSINGQEVEDVLDYIELATGENVEIEIQKQDGSRWILDIEKEPEEDLGIVFEQPLLDAPRRCCNRCIFCFVDQLPKGMRPTLYFKDDDWRMSFLMGNYVTLTNLTPHDMERITTKRISPLYVSVHTTNPKLRQQMMRNERAGNVLDILKEFKKNNIKIHCQIVLCPGWNDGKELDRTLKDLWHLRPAVQSVAVVPVGLTGHRKGMTEIGLFNRQSANQVIDQIEEWQNFCRQRSNTAFVFAADEFYILAQREFPSYESYEDFPQIENGVGLVVKFRKEFLEALNCFSGKKEGKEGVSIVTGLSAYRIIKDLIQCVVDKYGIKVTVYPVPNRFFGGEVTVAGLLTARDIISELKGRDLGEKVLIPSVVLRSGEDVFLDDTTLSELEENLGVPVEPVPVDGKALVKAIIEE